MTVEPNLEKFFVELKKADFNPSTLQEDEETLQLLLWYFDAGRTQNVMEEFFDTAKTPRKDAEQILTNLAKLYPLSTSLVMDIMRQAQKPTYDDGRELFRDAEFLEGFDMAKKMRDEIISVFAGIEGNVIRLTKETQEYLQEINNLHADMENLERQAENFRSRREERDELQRRVNQLQNDINEGELTRQIENLKDTERQLERTKNSLIDEKNKKQNKIDELKKEIGELENKKSTSIEEIGMIRELFRKFPVDAED